MDGQRAQLDIGKHGDWIAILITVPVKSVNFRKKSSGKYLGANRKAKENCLSGQIWSSEKIFTAVSWRDDQKCQVLEIAKRIVKLI